jgi:hypothetical protein
VAGILFDQTWLDMTGVICFLVALPIWFVAWTVGRMTGTADRS